MVTSIVLLCLFLLCVVISAVVGLVRGMNKSLIRFGTFLFAVILTFFVSGLVTNLVAENVIIKGQTLGELLLNTITENEIAAGIFAASPLLQEAILTVPAFAIAIVAFPLVFILLSFITWIVYLCIQRPLRKAIFKETFGKNKKAKAVQAEAPVQAEESVQAEEPVQVVQKKSSRGARAGKRFAGMGVGAVAGVLVFGMLFAPLFAVVGLLPENSALNEAIDTLVEQEVLKADVGDIIKQELKARDGFVLKAYDVIGVSDAGKLYLSAASKFEYGSHKTSIPDELSPIFSAAQVLVDGGLFKALMTSQDASAICAVLADKEVVNALISEMFKSQLLCSAVPEVLALAMEGLATTLKVPANKEAVYNNMMDDIAKVVQNGNVDYAAIKAYEEANPNDVIDYAPSEGGETPVIMTKEEYEAEVDKLVDLTLQISKIINTAVSGSTEEIAKALAGQIVKNVKTDVTENGKSVSDFSSDHVKGTISNISAESVDSSAAAVLTKLSNPESFETDVATVETIKNSIRDTVQTAMSDSSKAQETATVLSGAISSFAGAVENAIGSDGQIDPVKLDFGKIAEGVTGLQNSTLKDVGSSVLDIVVAGDLGGNAMVGTALGAIKESYDSGENISGAINSAGALIVITTTMTNNDGSDSSRETIDASFENLVRHLDETTMKLLPSIITDDMLISLGGDPQYTDTALSVVEKLLRELMALKGASDYTNEVDAVLELYNLIMKGVNNLVEDDIQKFIDSAMKSDAIYNTVIKLGDEGNVLFEIQSDSQHDLILDTIEAYYDESGKTQKEYDLFKAFSIVVGLGEEVELQ